MSCTNRFDQQQVDLCKQKSGIKTIYLANFADYVSNTFDTAGTSISGLTMSGDTGTNHAFYKLAQGKEISTFVDTASMPAETFGSISRSKITGQCVGISSTTIKMYNEFMNGGQYIAVIEGLDGQLLINGIGNGLDVTVATMNIDAKGDGFKGFKWELTGLEANTVYIMGTPYNTKTLFEAEFLV